MTNQKNKGKSNSRFPAGMTKRKARTTATARAKAKAKARTIAKAFYPHFAQDDDVWGKCELSLEPGCKPFKKTRAARE